MEIRIQRFGNYSYRGREYAASRRVRCQRRRGERVIISHICWLRLRRRRLAVSGRELPAWESIIRTRERACHGDFISFRERLREASKGNGTTPAWLARTVGIQNPSRFRMARCPLSHLAPHTSAASDPKSDNQVLAAPSQFATARRVTARNCTV
jgi:hypothetical protein